MAQTRNPIAAYLASEDMRPAELARLLKTSKGSISEIVHGKRRVGPKVARRMEKLTGRPWHEFVSPPTRAGA